MRLLFCATALFVGVCMRGSAGQANQDAHAGKNPLPLQPDVVDAGKAKFGEACAACHGANAEGGRGPNLVESARIRRMTDDQLFNLIRRGIPGTAMPAFPLPDNTIWQIAAFLRSLNTPAFLVPIAGDLRAGNEVYRKAGCASCHMLHGQGGFLGPDLTDVAARLTAKQLREFLLNPNSKRVEGFTGVTVVLKNGERVEGVAKNYSDYSIDLLDASGALHLLSTSEIREMNIAENSLMPDTYGKTLSQHDVQDLLAFLSRQTVRPDARPDQKIRNREEH